MIPTVGVAPLPNSGKPRASGDDPAGISETIAALK